MRRNRSYLYAPGHDAERLATAFDHGADVVVFDLEAGVPRDGRDAARGLVADALRGRPAWVRINPAGTADGEVDLEAVAGLAAGLRLPIICSIESAEGVLAAPAIAAVPGVWALSLGSRDLTADLGCEDTYDELLSVRRQLVAACRAAGILAVDSVYYTVADLEGLRGAADAARRLGFSGKSTLWPEQVGVINEAFR